MLSISVSLLLALCISISSASSPYDGQQVWRVTPFSEQQLNILKKLGDDFQLDFWREPNRIGSSVDFRVLPEARDEIRATLESHGITDYSVYILDVQKLINEQQSERSSRKGRTSTARTVESFDYTVYHEPEEVYDWMDMVVSDYSFAKKLQYGVSYEGRPLYLLEFKKNPTSDPKPVIFVDALIHCREWISTASLLFMFKEMLTNPSYTHMMDEVNWYFAPMVNVDGYYETWSGDRLWRKTKSTGPSSVCYGTDGNRNWDTHWSEPGASPNPCSYTYYGPTVESESEVRHLASYVLGLGLGKIEAYVTTHSYSQLILYPYGYAPVLTPDDAEMNMTSRMMHDAILAVHGMEYTWGPSATGIYVTSGATDDWAYDSAKVRLTYTFELRDTGRYGFLLPEDQIIPNGEEFLAGLEVLSDHVYNNFSP